MNKNKQNKAFTLVELIVVITILAVLATIAFISFKGYAASSRDSVRLADMKNMEKVNTIFKLKNGKYPIPNESINITFSGSTAWIQGVFGQNSYSDNISMGSIPTDPLTLLPYVYSVTNTRQEYQIGTVLEGEISQQVMSSKTYAGDRIGSVYIKGDYNGKFLKVNTGSLDYLLGVPSIIASDITSVDLIDIISDQRLVYKGYSNLPATYSGSVYNNNGGFPLALNKVILFEGNIDDLINNESERVDFLNNLQTNYSGSTIEAESSISEILSVNTDSEANMNNYVAKVLNNSLKTKIPLVEDIISTGGGGGGGGGLTDWTQVDPNCDIPDIVIGSQTWAGCNSTLGTGYDYVLQAGATAYCYDYGPSYWASSGNTGCRGVINKEIDYFDSIYTGGVNAAGGKGVDNIWGKHYSWDQAMGNIGEGACQNGYHLPSDDEWNILETNLGSTDVMTVGYRSQGLGWSENGLRTTSDNLINALLLPLAGGYRSDNGGMDFRGQRLNMWTSTIVGSEVYYRFARHDNIGIYRGTIGTLDLGFSVRCIRN